MKFKTPQALLLSLAFVTCGPAVSAQTTAFTYQGRLNVSNTPAMGNYLFRFSLFDQATAGGAVGAPVVTPVEVGNGLFAVTLDFGSGIFTGGDRWLGIEVRTNDGGSTFVSLTPHQQITSTPYAIFAAGVSAAGISGALPAANLRGTYGNALNFVNANNSFTGNGVELTNVNAARLGGLTGSNLWQTGGNVATVPGVHFLGTTDNKPLEFRANNQRVLRLDFSSDAPNILGGHPGNTIGGGALGATIAGGGGVNADGFPDYNSVNSTNGTIGGGAGIYIGTNSPASTIAGGSHNSIGDNAENSLIVGGRNNGIGHRAVFSTIGGGLQNAVGQTNWAVTIAGGQNNSVYSESRYATISGGYGNHIYDSYAGVNGGGYFNQMDYAYGAVISGGSRNRLWNAPYATVAGGSENFIDEASCATISGGNYNTIETNAVYGTVPGGAFALARNYGQLAYSAGDFGLRGDSQSSLYVLRGVTTNAVATELFLEGAGAVPASNRMVVPPNGVWAFDILVVATTANTTLLAGYQIKGIVAHQAAAIILLGTTVTPLYEDIGDWDANVIADSANEALAIVVKGSPVAIIRWVASVRTSEVLF